MCLIREKHALVAQLRALAKAPSLSIDFAVRHARARRPAQHYATLQCLDSFATRRPSMYGVQISPEWRAVVAHAHRYSCSPA